MLRVSDHYPVFVSLKPSVHPFLKRVITTREAVIVCDKRFPDVDYEMLVENPPVPPRYKTRAWYDKSGNVTRFEMKSHKMSDCNAAVKSLEKMRTRFPDVLSYSVLSAVRSKALGRRHEGSYWVVVVADLVDRTVTCSIEMETSLN